MQIVGDITADTISQDMCLNEGFGGCEGWHGGGGNKDRFPPCEGGIMGGFGFGNKTPSRSPLTGGGTFNPVYARHGGVP